MPRDAGQALEPPALLQRVVGVPAPRSPPLPGRCRRRRRRAGPGPFSPSETGWAITATPPAARMSRVASSSVEARPRLVVGLSLADEPRERRIDGAHDLLAHEQPGEMGPAHDLSSRGLGELVHGDGDAAALQLVHHAQFARVALGPEAPRASSRSAAPLGEPEPEQVELARARSRSRSPPRR